MLDSRQRRQALRDYKYSLKPAIGLLLLLLSLFGCNNAKEKFEITKVKALNQIKQREYQGENTNTLLIGNNLWLTYPKITMRLDSHEISINPDALRNSDLYLESYIFDYKLFNPRDKEFSLDQLEDALAFKDTANGTICFPLLSNSINKNRFLKITIFDSKETILTFASEITSKGFDSFVSTPEFQISMQIAIAALAYVADNKIDGFGDLIDNVGGVLGENLSGEQQNISINNIRVSGLDGEIKGIIISIDYFTTIGYINKFIMSINTKG